MATDTAPYRNKHYHLPSDTLKKIDFNRLALCVEALEPAVRDILKAYGDVEGGGAEE